MDAEERHDLKENELKSWMQYGFPVWIKQNGSYVLLVAALILLAYQIWNYYQKKQLAQNQAAWAELYATDAPGVENRPVKLQQIVEQYDLKPLRAMALRALGNSYLDIIATGQTDESSNANSFDKDDALNRAQAAYERILNEFPDQTLAVGAAKLGLAVIAEDRDDFDSARKQYEALTDKSSPFAGTAIAVDAAAKLADLDKRKNAPHLAAMLLPASTSPSTAPGTSPFTVHQIGPEGVIPSASAPATAPATKPAAK